MNNKSLAIRIFKSNFKRNLLIFVAIFITTFMIASSLSVAMSFLDTLNLQNLQLSGTAGHARVVGISERAVSQLQDMHFVESVGLATRAADVVFFADAFTLVYYDDVYWHYHKLPALLDVRGRPPREINEIMLSRRFLFQLDIDEPVLGMDVTINFWTANDQEHQAVFRLTGYYTSLAAAPWHEPLGVPVSAAFLHALGEYAISSTSASVIFANNNNDSIMRMQNGLYRQFFVTTTSDFNAGSPVAIMAIIAVLIFLLMLTGFLLIYNILNISVASDIRLFGLLKSVGTTPRQIYRIVLVQAVLLCIVAVPLGVGLAALGSIVFVPLVLQILGVQMTLVVSLSAVIFISAAILAVLTTLLGSLSPAKKAARISPIEATRYSEQELTKKRALFPTRGKPFLMALRNIFFRNKRRMVSVFLSLFFSSVLFMTVAVITSSMDAEQYLDGMFAENNFIIRNWPRAGTMSGGHFSPFEGRFIPPTFEDITGRIDEVYFRRLEALPGFMSKRYVTRAGGILTFDYAFIPYARGTYDFHIMHITVDGVTRRMTATEHAAWVNEQTTPDTLRQNFGTSVYGVCVYDVYAAQHLFNPPIDIDAFARGEAALFSSNRHPQLLDGIYNIELELSGGVFDFEIAGISSRLFADIRNFKFSAAPAIIVARPFLEEHAMTFVYQVDIRVYEEYEHLALAELEALTAHDDEILFGARLIERVGVQSMQLFFWTIGGSVAGVIGLTGLLNFINVMSVGIMARKKELAAMESIGMTRKQIRNMLVFEGTGYAAVVLVAAATLGNFIAISLFNFIYNNDGTGAYNFQYPFLLFAIAGILIATVCVCTPLIAYGKVNKTTLVERLRE